MSMETIYEPTMHLDGVALAARQGWHAEVIAGYQLVERIGSGGYGEVWRAVGPGGLPKAVKIMHGRFDGREADTELRSLLRMRELRHPFLLNIERIEVVENRLIIVTELTDHSLEDVFVQRQHEGHKGLPRETLLRYLRDVADALDFLCQRHGLQHLDVKPANLLLQGDHVKVADFGLIKDLKGDKASLVGGFTPLYAAPELFAGGPSEQSDQYGLAIVYQVLLTGVPPFAGRNAAQLMSQHLSSPPNLASLAPSDRPAVARALSKNPRARFQSCRQFIDRLTQRSSGAARSAAVAAPAPIPSGLEPAPAADGAATGCEAAGPGRAPAADSAASPAGTVPLPPAVLPSEGATFGPTLFIGLGGLGGKVLANLRRRLSERFGAQAELPALPLLLIDTDSRNINAIREKGALRDEETFAIPLRDPQYYRFQSGRKVLDWLSRRWLFNIPRSRQVENIRPLGRLAVSDHCDALGRRLRTMLAEAAGEPAAQSTAAATGLPFTAGPAVIYFVASLNGGTGSGAVLDVAYLLRAMAAELGVEAPTFNALFLHATSSRDRRSDIQAANAVACLNELRHFNTAGLGYPGDPACNLPACDHGPFDQTYVVSLGEGLGESQYRDETQLIAEYLVRGTATPARAFVDACRRSQRDSRLHASAGLELRTLRLLSADPRSRIPPQPDALALCYTVLRRWRGVAPRESRPAGAAAAVPAAILPDDVPQAVEQWATKAAGLLRGDVARKAETHFRTRWEQAAARGSRSELPLSDVDDDFATDGSGAAPADHPASLLRNIGRKLNMSATAGGQSIRSAVLELLDHPDHRLDGAQRALTAAGQRLDEATATLEALGVEMDKDLERIRQHLTTGSRQAAFRAFGQAEAALFFEYTTIRLYEKVYRYFLGYVDDVRGAIKRLVADLGSVDCRLRELEEIFHSQIPGRTVGNAVPAITAADAEAEVPVTEAHLRGFEEHLRLGRRVLPSRLLEDADGPRQQLASTLREQAVSFLTAVAAQALAAAAASPLALVCQGPLQEALQPRLSQLGGGHRVLGVVNEAATTEAWRAKLQEAMGPCVTLLQDPHGPPFLCTEVEGLAVDAVVAQVAEGKPQVLEMAARIHTRSDIHW